MIRVQIRDGQIFPRTDADRRALDERFPEGTVRLTSDNCPELANEIERLSAILAEQNRVAYEALAKYD